jgi:hypothetical protein
MQTMQLKSLLGRSAVVVAVVAVALSLSACAAPAAKPLYQWGGYQSSVYQFLKTNGSDPGAQIAQLEAEVQKNAASGAASPPGLHGHLALLYSKLGDDTNVVKHLEAERALFPESAAYIDFLLKNAAKKSTPKT